MKNTNKKTAFPKIQFGFDIEWETNNWFGILFLKRKFALRNKTDKQGLGDIPANLVDLPKLIPDKNEAWQHILKRIRKEIKKPEIKQIMAETIREAKANWKEREGQFFPILAKMLDIDVKKFEPKYFAYFTLSRMAPFKGNSFMFNRFAAFDHYAAHEIMHIEFLKAYAKYCKDKGLNDEKISHLKEILTELLNEDMNEILTRPEMGYLPHEKIRPKILELYRKNGGINGRFTDFLGKAIKLVKKTGLG